MDHELFLRMLKDGKRFYFDKYLIGVSTYHPQSKSCSENSAAWKQEVDSTYETYNLRRLGRRLRFIARLLRWLFVLRDNNQIALKEMLNRWSRAN